MAYRGDLSGSPPMGHAFVRSETHDVGHVLFARECWAVFHPEMAVQNQEIGQ